MAMTTQRIRFFAMSFKVKHLDQLVAGYTGRGWNPLSQTLLQTA